MTLYNIKCENLVRSYDFFIEYNDKFYFRKIKVYIIQDFCNGGTLENYMKLTDFEDSYRKIS